MYAFEINRDLLFRQIAEINPSIVIFGNTFNLGYDKKEEQSNSFYDYWGAYRQANLKIESFSQDAKLSKFFNPQIDLTQSHTLDKYLKCYYESKKSDACLFFEICHFGALKKWHYQIIPEAIKLWRGEANLNAS